MRELILYSTLFGHNLELSQLIAEHYPQMTRQALTKTSAASLINYDHLIICPCTYGDGYLTPLEEQFFHQVQRMPLPHLSYLVVGAGDLDYGHAAFARAVLIFDRALHDQGARRLGAPIRVDYEEVANGARQAVAQLKRVRKEIEHG